MNDHKDKKSRFKKPGSILATTLVAAIVWIMIAQAMFVVSSGQFKMIKSSRVALQAQQYAEITVDTLKNINYDELDTEGAHSRQSIKGIAESSDWEDEVTIGAESTIAGSDDVKQRIATVNVYKKGDTLPRFTLEVPLSSKGSGNNLHVETGIVSNGQRIPLPTGFSESECIWFVSAEYQWGWHGAMISIPVESFCFVDSDRIVHVYKNQDGTRSGNANYILIAKKGGFTTRNGAFAVLQ